MTPTLMMLDAVLCALIALRLLAYRKQAGNHRPFAGALAYLMIVAAAAVPLLLLFGQEAGLSRLVLDSILCAALFASHGNVIELFRCSDRPDGPVARMLGRRAWF